MASVRKTRGKWQAQVRRKGFKTLSRTFDTKGAASAWAKETERELELSDSPEEVSVLRHTTLGDLLERYRDRVTQGKKSRRQETYRINYLLRQPVSKLTLDGLTTGVFARYRDARLQQVGPQTVLHELNTLSVVLRVAKLDWDVPLRHVLVDRIRKPRLPPGRDRRLGTGEYQLLESLCRQSSGQFMWKVVEFAIETALRKSEILNLEWPDIDSDRKLLHVRNSKNGLPRRIPLSERAMNIITEQKDAGAVAPFPVTERSIRYHWCRIVNGTTLSDLRFHDLRHEAISRLFEKGLSVPEVALISGHKDFRMLARYTHVRAENIRL